MAQAYNHSIMPLANRRDKRTQVLWGIRDFEHRFGRSPRACGSPETAVDLETLESLAEQGIRFTILAPTRPARVRPRLGDEATWQDVGGGRIDPPRLPPELPSGRSIALFFYDGPISRAVAFERLLASGEDLADRLLASLLRQRRDGRSWSTSRPTARPTAIITATATWPSPTPCSTSRTKGHARLTNYGEYPRTAPARRTRSRSSRTPRGAASHGVERWREDCGCRTGPGWNQDQSVPHDRRPVVLLAQFDSRPSASEQH